MSETLRVPESTRLAQLEASHPRASAWVSANAGSGKTYVLSQRIIRLLLDDVSPGKILALTFTKAAAANMATRVFSILSQWVTLEDAALSREIERLDGAAPGPARLALARRLFARAVETPGGLKIQTIHAFCERVLHLFPFEANVAARFEVLDDAAAAEMMALARAHVLTHALGDGDRQLAEALALVNEVAGEDGFARLMTEALSLGPVLAQFGRGRPGIEDLCERLAEALGLAPGETIGDIETRILEGGFRPADWPTLCERFRIDGKSTEAKHAEALARAAEASGAERLFGYLSVFLTDKLEPRADTFLTKGFCAANPALADRLKAERGRVHALLDRRKAAEAVARTRALLLLADGVIAHYQRQKSQRGALDFDDLIRKTLALFSRSDAAWVLYKLDQGVDHVLVDEAQDTSDPQWSILRALTEDFISGAALTERVRTIFAVGDPKQSIFSFQGASPEAFETSRRYFAERIGRLEAEDAERWAWRERPLTLSFRSAPDVLRSVDDVFADAQHHAGLNRGDPVATVHQSARAEAQGLVEIWDVETPVVTQDPDAWSKPLDAPDERAPSVRLAERIARQIRRWMTVGDAGGQRIRPGEVLILVRNRNAFFEAVIRALKDANVPVAGADRLALTSHIAVMDLLALGRACLTPQDDLTVAEVLKSPLVGLSEEELYELAVDRPGSLSRALAAAAEREPFRPAQEKLARWKALAASTGPFGFYAAVLGPGGGRRAMLSRLGPEAGDAVDEFLRLALEHEQRETPSLALFLHAMESADITVKRDMEAGRDEVRVMTVHGAKGLEASVVFMADTCSAPNGRHDAPILRVTWQDGPDAKLLPVWSPSSGYDSAVIRASREEAREAARDEYHRLLYVAMTRAKDRLYICGFEGAQKRAPNCWYDMVRRSLEPFMAQVPAEDGRGDVLRRQSRPFAPPAAAGREAAAQAPVAPAWLATPARPE
ncbi:double-strand break repair helicase AddA, partial [Alsobacter soli]